MTWLPSVLAGPRPVAGWVTLATVNGTLPSGSLSLPRTLIGKATPRVAAVSLTAVGSWFGATLTVTVVTADCSPLLSWAR
ncbi:hypothetical protein D3C76_1808960 [compost metagenome]